MRLLTLLTLLAALALASCKRGEDHIKARATVPNATQAATASVSRAATQPPCINLNTATAEQLMELPGVGAVMSRRIVEYRERHGPFRRPAEIIVIENFSEKKYRAIADRLCVE